MTNVTKLNTTSHRRYNPLTGEWLLVSPHRAKRPWQGKTEKKEGKSPVQYDPGCYLCPGNERVGGVANPDYKEVYVFDNDFPALLSDVQVSFEDDLFTAKSEQGICRVVCFSPDHGLTLSQMAIDDIKKVVDIWVEQYMELGARSEIKYVQIFENRGEMMGCSNPHPHGQIWATENVPNEPAKEMVMQQQYFERHGRTLLGDYLNRELQKNERIVIETDHFVVLVPFWAVWPFETMIVSKRTISHMGEMSEEEREDFARALRQITQTYDGLFEVSFPYSSGIHQAPTDGKEHPEWHFHMHFYPPLLRSATVKKFMVGFEMLGTPQRDITPEESAQRLITIYQSFQ
ncbi:UDP-glucose--hexose-1-phosphate uridylyltransferase [Fulvivirga sp. 29W222]|uniref:Galactose-1-phosphate uridylyltransferase n=1 Tax=Fulvivirga marina TaxID=2494733 RepID=A0A937KDX9_9BACT|nr:UDP-glucose--hexose-1-phosphate uridylyltransferase [Fulvivirga marina]MBL6446673.1 UDP-glucose--hexose-1-phosphate uridylyltransferase [Fulvivirga marina]